MLHPLSHCLHGFLDELGLVVVVRISSTHVLKMLHA